MPGQSRRGPEENKDALVLDHRYVYVAGRRRGARPRTGDSKDGKALTSMQKRNQQGGEFIFLLL